MALIVCEKVTFAYEGHTVVNALNMKIERGQYLCIVGENGSGKSTLVKGLLGLLSPIKGSVKYADGLKRNEIGYLPQKSELQKDFPASVWEVVTSGCRGNFPFLTPAQKKLATENLRLMGIENIKNKCFVELSGGQQQRVLLARALCATRTMLLLDEPVAGLDPLVTKEMYDVIEMLNKQNGLTVVMISHDIEAALCYADRVLHMSQSESFLGTVDEYRHSQMGQAFAGGLAHD